MCRVDSSIFAQIFDNLKRILERAKQHMGGRRTTATGDRNTSRRGDAALSIPELIAQMRRQPIAETDKGITHAEFVAARRAAQSDSRMVGEPLSANQEGVASLVIFVFLYMAAPAVLVPFWAWHEHDWWLLLGIVASALGSGVATRFIYRQDKQYSIAASLVIASIASWATFGIHRCYTFWRYARLGLDAFHDRRRGRKEYAYAVPRRRL